MTVNNEVTLRLSQSQADLVQKLIATSLDAMEQTMNGWKVEIGELELKGSKEQKKDLIDVLTSLVEAA